MHKEFGRPFRSLKFLAAEQCYQVRPEEKTTDHLVLGAVTVISAGMSINSAQFGLSLPIFRHIVLVCWIGYSTS